MKGIVFFLGGDLPTCWVWIVTRAAACTYVYSKLCFPFAGFGVRYRPNS